LLLLREDGRSPLYLAAIEYSSYDSRGRPITFTDEKLSKLDTNVGSVNRMIGIPLFPNLENNSKYVAKFSGLLYIS